MRRLDSFFKAGLILSLLSGATGGRLAAQVINHAVGTEAGQDLALTLRTMRPEQDMNWTGTLQIFGRGHHITPIPITFQSATTATNWSFTYLTGATDTTGAEKLTIIFSTNAPTQYLYARASASGAALGEPKKLTGAEADLPLVGSDFWLSDLGFEFYHWPEQNRLKGEQKRSRACYVVESRNPHPAPGGYLRVKTWVDEKYNQPLQAEAYVADHSKPVKSFEVGSVSHHEVKDLKMFNIQTGSWTELNFDLKDK